MEKEERKTYEIFTTIPNWIVSGDFTKEEVQGIRNAPKDKTIGLGPNGDFIERKHIIAIMLKH